MNRQCILIFSADTVIEVFLWTLIAFYSNQQVSLATVMLVTMHLKPGCLINTIDVILEKCELPFKYY